MPRVAALTGLRWWAAFFVFTYHMLVFAPLPAIAAVFLEYGFFGVTFFFVLSGFVLTWSATAQVSQSTFYWRRFARIYPSLLVSLIIAVPVFYSFDPDPIQTWVKPFGIGILLLCVVVLQGWSRDPVVLFAGNPAAWTLTCEAFFYALHPYISRILYRIRVRGALIFVALVGVLAFSNRAAAVMMPGTVLAQLPWPIVRLTEFAIGMGLAWAFRCGWRPRIPVAFGLAALAGSLAVIVLVPHYLAGSDAAALVQEFGNELFTVACAIAILALAAGTLRARRSLFAHQIQVRLGEWSYAFYLVHATFIYIALALLGRQSASWLNLGWYVVLLVVGLAGAAALHYVVEKPAERRIRAWKDAWDARTVA